MSTDTGDLDRRITSARWKYYDIYLDGMFLRIRTRIISEPFESCLIELMSTNSGDLDWRIASARWSIKISVWMGCFLRIWKKIISEPFESCLSNFRVLGGDHGV